MQAEVKWIEPNDCANWAAFTTEDPLDDFGWFTLGIGDTDSEGDETFQVLISTPAAIPRAQGNASRFRGLITPQLTVEDIQATLHRHVSSVSGTTWNEVVSQLRRTMDWEYDGVRGA